MNTVYSPRDEAGFSPRVFYVTITRVCCPGGLGKNAVFDHSWPNEGVAHLEEYIDTRKVSVCPVPLGCGLSEGNSAAGGSSMGVTSACGR